MHVPTGRVRSVCKVKLVNILLNVDVHRSEVAY